MVIFLIYLVIPVLWLLFAKITLHHKFTWKEAGVQSALTFVIAMVLSLLVVGSTNLGAMDTELINGQVVDKYNQRVSCSHSYECNCTYSTDSNGNRTKSCQTCYKHPFDVNWIVESTVGKITIPRVNSQGTREPPRFTEVELNEPVTRSSRYMNYVKANPDSIFNDSQYMALMEDYGFSLPNYPEVHDIYRINRVLVTSPDIPRFIFRQLNESISMDLRTLSSEKEVNVVVVITDESNPQYANALQYKWLGGNKNDIVIVMGITDYPTIEWIDSFGWSESSRVFNEINDHYRNTELDVDTFSTDLSAIIREHYERQSFSQYQYLMEELSPPLWLVILGFFINLMACISLGYYFIKHDPFD